MAVIIVFTTELEMGSFSNRNLLNWHIIHVFTFSEAKNFLFPELMLLKTNPMSFIKFTKFKCSR